MRPMTARQVIRVLRANGFVLSRQRGSHMIWRHSEKGIIVPVPLHGQSKPIHIGTLLAIVKQSKIPKEEFERNNF
ncbi:hypothetical protein A3H10_00770 [Candidatus Uhrbacteria bacterium RIFCSPLOWO2_12_FULL_46_10]|uniref:Addiction module toxin, HicA family n=1 Tax=Candidatus Uhrbacteria bacterium RIFCSPLOWO2_01_FULL_47_25 TaxID=1802402 RepID=A0A1F7URU8_9BACT|nr:MAG: hypothetical protein A2752_02290 [Candidatus Uhrbacteria bacterium RIFCSPHIGHO2_01_FULL_46_23]OGL68128.1 MAG: hypothetical protein A3D60_03945 [Candidatus Uhrbacteria bacterium RIFCSPHIGHO2_02_FULL_47_29]OGL74828.1 MAG: hypothetical protein A3E96_04745 [Candidatus Uhrbacteria bacterium RIFCSPHIGHO2_12_FULL_46_13]OGL80979.1 MAG: hypothetical protein A2936_03280 [Candidatus Uhrbacteria bacterium RIFCSPLOWO2_01_FULL_47_25]OGL84700.1 MAG: hypothetical protein A3I37_05030 [Candidatus Uhrbact